MVCLLTDLMEHELSDAAAGRVYRRRWGVEVFYRTLKQTMDRRKMLSRTRGGAGDRAVAELHATVLGAWLLGLMGARATIDRGESPARLSPAGTLRVIRTRPGHPHRRTPRRRGARLAVPLAAAVRDTSVRTGSKRARHRKNKKYDPRPGPPKLTPATAMQIKAAPTLAARSGAT